MDFLPLEIDNKKVYAGFWKRFGSGIVDVLVLIPFMYLFYLIDSLSLLAAVCVVVVSSLLYSSYTIYFHYKYGATIGKMATGIKVTLPNGKKIGIKAAVLRSSVDLIFAALMGAAQIQALLIADSDMFLNSSFTERYEYLLPLYPAWYALVNVSSQLWVWSELIVLLFNKRKRALHDFIAGTVVINQSYAKQV